MAPTPPTRARIIVVGDQPNAGQAVNLIRRWHHEGDGSKDPIVSRIKDLDVDLASSLSQAAREGDHDAGVAILALNPSPGELFAYEANAVFLARVDPRNPLKVLRPSSSPNAPWKTTYSSQSDLLSALRKALLRLQAQRLVEARAIVTEAEFSQYFSLRYDTWERLGYLAADYGCSESRWELSSTDLQSIPIGLFPLDDEDRLIGCIRLILDADVKRLTPWLIHIINTHAALGERRRLLDFLTTGAMAQPYDVLRSFEEFSDMYRQWVVTGTAKAEISRVIVSPDYHGLGLGEVLVDCAVDKALQVGIRLLFLACLEKHTTLYARSSFRQVPGVRCDRFDSVGVPAVAMTLQLPEGATGIYRTLKTPSYTDVRIQYDSPVPPQPGSA